MRMEHIPKFVEYSVRPSFYTLHTFCFADTRVANRGTDQASCVSLMRDAIDAGLRPTNHTDFVVAPLDQRTFRLSGRSCPPIRSGFRKRVDAFDQRGGVAVFQGAEWADAMRLTTLDRYGRSPSRVDSLLRRLHPMEFCGAPNRVRL